MRKSMADIPRDRAFDSTVALLSEGYRFVPTRCERNRSDAFETRLMLRRVVCAQGANAARMFFEPGRFTRKKALPMTTVRLLQDKGSVQLLDGDAHRHRKQMFMSLTDPASVRALRDIAAEEWEQAAARWRDRGEIVLHYEVQEILCRTACRWAGLTLNDSQIRDRTAEFAAMIEGAGAVGPRHWRGAVLRARSERWCRGVVADIRAGRIQVPRGSPADTVVSHVGLDGRPLDTAVAAVELLNVLRPTVACARFIAFAALALHEHPESRRELGPDGDDSVEMFVHEVRRFYPFFPFLGGRALEPFDWRNRRFEKGDWVVLDLYGTNRDAQIWESPDRFQPERFRNRQIGPAELVPQGGGTYVDNHRCPGEPLTLELMKHAVRFLTGSVEYQVPPQDTTIDLGRMPAMARSGFRIREVRLRQPAA